MDVDAGFRQRCAAALTHPVTLASLALFLLNDLALKPLWPEAWATGKLSDLAFVVVASPLFAFLLSLLVRDSPRGGRLAFAVAYGGLPVLYAAFNTFAGVHEPIVDALSVLNGGSTQSPLDATDSIVIPPGLALALWVWRRPPGADLRRRLVVVVAGLIALTSIASQPPPTEEGVRFEGQAVETPRGTFAIEGTDIVHEGNVVYSTAFLSEQANLWLQERDTRHLGDRHLTTRPHGISFDAATGNVIVGMGIQGVVIGTPDGKWTPEEWPAQEEWSRRPTDFSRPGRARALTESLGFWTLALAMAASAVVVGLLIADARMSRLWALPAGIVATVPVAVLWVLPVAVGVGWIWLAELTSVDALIVLGVVWLAFVSPVWFIAFPFLLLGMTGGHDRTRELLRYALAILSLLLTGAALAGFGVVSWTPHPDGPFVSSGGILNLDPTPVVAAVALLLAAGVIVGASRQPSRYWRPAGLAAIVAFALVWLAWMWWVQLGSGLLFTQAASALLVALVAVTLGLYVRWRVRAAEAVEPPPGG